MEVSTEEAQRRGAAGAGPEDTEDTEEVLSILGLKRLDMPPFFLLMLSGNVRKGGAPGQRRFFCALYGFRKGQVGRERCPLMEL